MTLSPAKRALLEVLRTRGLPDAVDTSAPTAPAAPPVLSAAQQRMWVIEQTEPDAAAYNTVRAVDLRGTLDVPALRAAFTRVVERHEALRTIVLSDGGRPVARVLTDPEAEFEVVDAPDPAAAEALIDAVGARAFDLVREVPVRALLVRVSADRHLLGIVLHHIASDEGSRNILWRDLATAYASETGHDVAVPPPALPYREFARWQADRLARIRDAELAFWGDRLAGAPQRLTLPPDRVRSKRQSFRGARRRVELPDDLVAGMRGVAREQRATLFMTALAAYLWLVRQWTGETDVVVGMPVTARGDGRFDDTIGLFVNTVVLRTDCSGTPSFRELVDRVRATVIEALEHRDLPFDDVVDVLAADRDQAWNPLVQILVNGTKVQQDGLAALPGLDATVLDLDPGTSKFDTGVLFAENDRGFEVVLGYASEVYRPETIETLFDQLHAVLRAAVTAPDAPLTAQALWSPTQRGFLDDVNDTATDPPRGTLHGAIEAQVRATPDRPAAGDARTGWITYRELDERANRLAQRLRSLGAGPGTRVAFCVARSVHTEVGVLAILKSGAAYVPLDAEYPVARLAFMLADCDAAVLLTDSANAAVLPPHRTVVLVDDETLADEPADPPEPLTSGTDPAYVIYTSGSTGKPKGVVVAHAGVVNRLRWMQDAYPLDGSDTVLQKTPLSFDVSGWEVLWPLMVGARVFLLEPGGHRDPGLLAETIAAQDVTTMHFVPSMLDVFLGAVDAVPGVLRTVFASGEALSEATRDAFFRADGARLVNLYGPTEASIDVTCAEQRPDASDIVRIGRPISNTSVHVVDADGLPVPVGVAGELCLAGVGLADGYLGRPELTAERFTTAAWDPAMRIYRTGDLARWTSRGEIAYLGRLDDQVKIRGLRIELGEIEAAIADHPLVQLAAVRVVPDAGGQPGLVGYAVPAPAVRAEIDTSGADVGDVSDWNTVWDRTYADPTVADGGEPAADYRGWMSSYDGAAIPDEQMAAWVDETVQRIRDLRPRRIAEIGCGSGLLLDRLAPDVERYVGLDFSAATVERVARRAAARGWQHVDVRVAAAHEAAAALSGEEPFDVVVVNSVVQYFPDGEYLESALEAALRVVARPGWMFAGDIRNLRSASLFELDVARSRLDSNALVGEVASAARLRAAYETELLVDPAWFDAFATARADTVGSVDHLLKGGPYRNEMTCFRYDAVLGIGRPSRPPPGDLRAAAVHDDLDGVLAELAAGHPCTGIPDARVQAAAALAAPDASHRATARQVAGGAPAGIDPAALQVAARSAGLRVAMSPAGPDRFDASVCPPGSPVPRRAPGSVASGHPLTNDPRAAAAAREHAARLTESLRASLAERLPAYMVPPQFVVLDDLPLSANGKLDRARLPLPERPLIDTSGQRPPSGADEELVAAAFVQLLGVAAVGADSDFFALGGHSLSAARLAATLERRSGVRVGLNAVFAEPTVAALASRVAQLRAIGGDRAPAFAPDPGGEVFLSPAQERMIFLGELTGSNALYGLRRVMRLRAALDTGVLAGALQELAARHQALRTMVASTADGPAATVAATPDVPLHVDDLRTRPDPLAAALALADRVQDDGFDLGHGPLARAHALQLADDDWVLLLHVHHVAVDALSLDLLTDDLAVVYEARRAGRPVPPPAPAAQYADYAREQRAGIGVDDQLAYWRGQLAGRPDGLDLPTDRPRPPVVSYAGDRLGVTLDARVTAAVDALARRCSSTRFTVLFAALSVVLSRLSGQPDVLVGTPTSGRTRPEYESTVGLFVNTVVLRARPDDALDFESLVAAAKRTVVDALRHQDVPFERVVEDLAPTRDTSRNPLFQVLLNLVPGRPGERRLAGAPLEPLDVGTRSARFDLSVTVTERDSGLFVALEYSTDLFEAATVERIGARLLAVLDAATADPRAPLRDLDVVLPDERATLARWSSGPRIDLPAGGTLELIRGVARRAPDSVAVIGQDATLTYAQLLAQAEMLAERLRSAGADRAGRIGVAASRGSGLVVAQLGIWMSGNAYVPLDPAFPDRRLRFMAEDAGLDLVVVDPGGDAPDALAGLVRPVPLPGPGAAGGPEGTVGSVGPLVDERLPAGDDPAYLIYTSGSTGRPKGVVVGHRALANLLASMALEPGCTADDVLLAVTTISFDIAGLELLLPLIVGGTVAVATAAEAADPHLLGAAARRTGATVLQATPSTWRLLVDSGWSAPGLSALCGGEPLDDVLAGRLRPRVARLWNCYGPTETTIWSTVDEIGGGPVTVGRPIAATYVTVRDARARLVPPGVVGELLIGGTGLAEGYWQRPELTAERFPMLDGARAYRTGDLARWRSDGRLEVLGRTDHQVKVRGHRIELGEIEAVVLTVDGVRETVVVVDDRGADDRRLIAYAGGTADAEQVRVALRAALPGYMVPGRIVTVPALPRTANNKIDRAALPQADATDRPADTPEPPQGALEQAIASAWAQLLGIAQVSRDDDFFSLGGHSLLAGRMIGRLSDDLGLDVPLRLVFEASRLADLAKRIAVLDAGVTPAPDEPALSAAQARMWMLHALDPASGAYNVPILRRLDGPLDDARLASAIAALGLRHPALHTVYLAGSDDLPVPVARPDASLSLVVHDRPGMSWDELEGTVRAAAMAPFDLESGPVARAELWRCSDTEAYLLLCVHHIAADGGSVAVLLGDLAALHAGDELPAVRGQRLPAADRDVLDWWSDTLDGAPAETVLPVDRPRRAARTVVGRRERRLLGPGASRALAGLARERGATVFSVTLAAVAALLHRHGAGDDLVVGVPTSGRTSSGPGAPVGPLVNTLPIRVATEADETFGALMTRTADALRAALTHDAVAFEEILDAVERRGGAVSHDRGSHPLFQVVVSEQPVSSAALRLGEATLGPVAIDWQQVRYDLAFIVAPGPDGVALALDYRTELFDDAGARALLDRLVLLVTAVSEAPDTPVGDLPVLTAADRSTLTELADDAMPLAVPRTLPDRVRELAAADPLAPAVISGPVRLDRGQLLHAADVLTERLRAAGVDRGDLVGLAVGHRVEWLVGLLAIWGSGAGFVAIDPSAPVARSAEMLRECSAAAIVTSVGPPHTPELPLATLCVDVDELLAAPAAPPAPAPHPDDVAYVIYTSGTTGRPKGSVVEHHSLAAFTVAHDAALPAATRRRVCCINAPLAFDASMQQLTRLAFGDVLDLVPDDVRRSPRDMVDYLDDHEVDLLDCTPTHLRMLAAEGLLERPRPRILLVGGEAVDTDLWAALLRSPQITALNCYGPTEVTVEVLTAPIAGDLPVLGRPLPGVGVRVHDPRGAAVPPGVAGELWLSGAQVSRGYLDRAELTAERFLGAADGTRCYRTGDLVRVTPSGDLAYLGRLDDQVKIRGHRIELGEVDAAFNAAPGVERAVAVVREDGSVLDLAVYVLLAPDAGADALPEIRRIARSALPASMWPRWLARVEGFPLTSSGKIDRQRLALVEPADDDTGGRAALDLDDPEQQLVAQIWADVLGGAGPESVDDDFFDIGGNSLLAITVLSRLRELGIDVGTTVMFDAPTLRRVADAVAEELLRMAQE